ncbi:unnamed protein product, partial [Prorocentrum cordatum]
MSLQGSLAPVAAKLPNGLTSKNAFHGTYLPDLVKVGLLSGPLECAEDVNHALQQECQLEIDSSMHDIVSTNVDPSSVGCISVGYPNAPGHAVVRDNHDGKAADRISAPCTGTFSFNSDCTVNCSIQAATEPEFDNHAFSERGILRKGAASRLLGGGRKATQPKAEDMKLLEGLRLLLGAPAQAPPKQPPQQPQQPQQRRGKQTLREALQDALGRARTDNALKGKLVKILKAVDGGHITLSADGNSSGAPPAGDNKGKGAAAAHSSGGGKGKGGEAANLGATGAKAKDKTASGNPNGSGKGKDNGTGKPPAKTGSGAWSLWQRDWPDATLSRAGAVLGKLRQAELPSKGQTATLADTVEEADEMLALWRQHFGENSAGEEAAKDASLTVGVVVNPVAGVSWKPSGAARAATKHITLSKMEPNEKLQIKLVALATVGKEVTGPAGPVVQSAAKLPVKVDTITVRLTVFDKYMDALSLGNANALLKQVWPAGAKGMQLGNWRPTGSHDEAQSYNMYVTGTKEQVDALIAISGKKGVFVGHLATNRNKMARTTVSWVPRPADSTDKEYLEIALQAAAGAPLVHRIGGGPDLGFERAGIDVKASPPFVWKATTPKWWRSDQLESFLTGNGWTEPQVTGDLGHGVWRFRAKARPAESTSYMWEGADPSEKITALPMPRKVKQETVGKQLRRPALPWLDDEDTKPDDDVAMDDADKKDQPGAGGPPAPAAAAGGQGADQQGKQQGQQPPRDPATKQGKGADDGDRAHKRLRLDGNNVIKDKTCILDGYEVVETGGKGACGYCAVVGSGKMAKDTAADLSSQEVLDKIMKEAGTLRVQTVQQMTNNPDVWEPYWCFDPKAASHTGRTWAEYLNKCTDNAFYMDELQLTATATRLKRMITVVYRDDKNGWARRTLGDQFRKKGWFVLTLVNEHFQAVRPVASGWPEALAEDVGGSMPCKGRGGSLTSYGVLLGHAEPGWQPRQQGHLRQGRREAGQRGGPWPARRADVAGCRGFLGATAGRSSKNSTCTVDGGFLVALRKCLRVQQQHQGCRAGRCTDYEGAEFRGRSFAPFYGSFLLALWPAVGRQGGRRRLARARSDDQIACEEFETFLCSARAAYSHEDRALPAAQKAEMDGLTAQMHQWLDSSRAGGRAPTRAAVNEKRIEYDAALTRCTLAHPLRGDSYACPCGWRPSPGADWKTSNDLARAHWSACQPGRRWPRLPAEKKRALLTKYRGNHVAGCSAAAWAKYDGRMGTMTGDFKAKCCDLDRTDQQCTKNTIGCKLTAFKCTRCDAYVQRNRVWERPCPAAGKRPLGQKKGGGPLDLPTLWEWRAAAKGLSGQAAKDNVAGQAAKSNAKNLAWQHKRKLDRTDAERAEDNRKRRPRQASDGQLRVWSCNVNGLKDQGPDRCQQGSVNTGKWDRVLGQLAEHRAQVCALQETHMDTFSSRRFVAQARAGGFDSCYTSAGTNSSAGVALLGPPELREDPWAWGGRHQGRVVSGILSVRGQADVLIVVVYGDVNSQDNRASLYDDVAARAAQAGLPTIVVGDFNCEPYDSELFAFRDMNYCHEMLDIQDITTHGERLLDFACLQQLEAQTFATDTAISDHDAIVFELWRELRTQVQTVVKFDELNPPLATEDWDETFSQTMDKRRDEWDGAAARQDVEAMWALWCDMLEDSAGVPGNRHRRKHGTVLKRWERVCKGPDGQRQTVVERRLHRLLRRVHHALEGPRAGSDGLSLFGNIRSGVQSLVDDGVLGEGTAADGEDLAALRTTILAKLQQLAEENRQRRLAAWRERQQAGDLKANFRYVADRPPLSVKAASDQRGRPTADPKAIVAAAVRQWKKKQHPRLEQHQIGDYLREVRDVVEHVEPPDIGWMFEAPELRAALRKTAGTAAGPGQIKAEQLAQAPGIVLDLLADLANAIRDTGTWPAALKAQEVTMIPKTSDKPDLRPIGVAQSVARAISRVAVSKYKQWASQVQPTDAHEILLTVDLAIEKAAHEGTPLHIRQSDLSNCFTRIQPELVVEVAVLFGMHRKDAVLLFMNNVGRDTVVKVSGYASDLPLVLRGLAQGDPASPLGAAILAGAHARKVCSVFDVGMGTYVDDRTTYANDRDTLDGAEALLRRLDELSGQKEDDSKQDRAAVNVAGGQHKDHLDLLGVRLDLTGRKPPAAAPRARKRVANLLDKLRRLRTVAKAARLGRRARKRVVMALAGSIRWDAPWCSFPKETVTRVRSAMELALESRRRHAAWRHKGAAWCMEDKAWKFEPDGLALSSTVSMLRRVARTHVGPAVEARWDHCDGSGLRWLDRVRGVLETMGWHPGPSPFEVAFGGDGFHLAEVSKSFLDHCVRETWRAHMMRTCRITARKVPVEVPSLDVKTLRRFVEEAPTAAEQRWRWRCCVGAEPSPDRLSHVTDEVAHDCPICHTAATTWHLMWRCDATEHERQRRGLHEATIGRHLPQHERSALLLNGWARAEWDPPDGQSHDAHRAAAKGQGKLALNILRLKDRVLKRYWDIFVGIAPEAGHGSNQAA